jgi:regulator of nucleoside diphosphate kinase
MIQITQSDFDTLQTLLRKLPGARPGDKGNLQALAGELLRARIRPGDAIPPDVITLRSRARLRDLGSGDLLELSIVLPGEADVEQGRISVLAPLGTAMLGYRAGDVFEWEMPGGPSRFRVEEVLFQPEAAGEPG